jgi:hypothetical protein
MYGLRVLRCEKKIEGGQPAAGIVAGRELLRQVSAPDCWMALDLARYGRRTEQIPNIVFGGACWWHMGSGGRPGMRRHALLLVLHYCILAHWLRARICLNGNAPRTTIPIRQVYDL